MSKKVQKIKHISFLIDCPYCGKEVQISKTKKEWNRDFLIEADGIDLAPVDAFAPVKCPLCFNFFDADFY